MVLRRGAPSLLHFMWIGSLVLIASCTSIPRTTTTPRRADSVDVGVLRSSKVVTWLRERAIAARSLSVSGNLTADQDGSTNSADFKLKSKRLDPAATSRIDSFSIVITGPFGITVARFLASPESYTFHNILLGDVLRGHTDARSLEELTQLKGVTLSMMNDLVYGLAPAADDLLPEDSIVLYSSGTHHSLVVFRHDPRVTEVLDLEGSIPVDTGRIAMNAMQLLRYQRWSGVVADPIHTTIPPSVTIRYGEPKVFSGVVIAQRIEAVAGRNKMALDYNEVEANPQTLIVRIKMPEQ